MNKIMKRLVPIALCIPLLLSLFACGKESGESFSGVPESGSGSVCESGYESGETGGTDEEKGLMRVLKLPDIVGEAEDLQAFIRQSEDKFSAQKNGIVVSPYYSVRINGESLPVYATPANYGSTQNIAFIDVSKDAFPLQVSVAADHAVTKAEILPTYYGVVCTVMANRVSFPVGHFGYYTVQFDGSYENVLTVAVREYEEPVVPEGYQLVEYKAGIHFVDSISLSSDTMLYLHSGAYLIAEDPTGREEPETAENYHGETQWKPFLSAERAENVIIAGRGVLDMSALYWCARNPVEIGWSENVTIDGLTIVNTANWNVTVHNSRNVEIRNVILLSTRRNSDGIAIVDCDGAFVHDCFARSGDDLFEVKSMYADSDVSCRNIRFTDCIAWADSCRCFGIIHETARDISDVTFSRCATLYAMAEWSQDMGSLVVINGIRGTVSDIIFRDIEVYCDKQYAVNVATGPNEWSEGSTEIGKIRNVLYDNIRIVKGGGVRIKAPDDCEGIYIEGVVFRNIELCGRKAGSLSDLNILFVGDSKDVRYEE